MTLCEQCPHPATSEVLTVAGKLLLCKQCADAWWRAFMAKAG